MKMILQMLSDHMPHALEELEKLRLSKEKLTTILHHLANEEIITIVNGNYIQLT